MSTPEIRWRQRFENYQKALMQLARFIAKGELNEFELQGLIQCFEYTYELAWNTMRDFLQSEGHTDLVGSRTTLKAAFKAGLINDAEGWGKMIEDRNISVHTYNEGTAEQIASDIFSLYFQLFQEFQAKMQSYYAL